MLFAIDTGNTQTMLGLYRSVNDRSPFNRWRIATVKQATADDLFAELVPLLQWGDIHPKEITQAVLSSVVPSLTRSWTKALARLSGLDCLICSAAVATKAGLFQTTYPNPREIGADRVADAIALREVYGAPSVVVDFGTATNIEVIDRDGFFRGGIIAPGVETASTALFTQASRLAAIDLVAPPAVIGNSTEEAIQSGIILGEVARVEGLVRRVFEFLGYECPVVATGGFAFVIAQATDLFAEVNFDLTLTGLRLLVQRLEG